MKELIPTRDDRGVGHPLDAEILLAASTDSPDYHLMLPMWSNSSELRDSEDAIPQSISDGLQSRLGDNWQMNNRGRRLEFRPVDGAHREDEFVVGVVKTYFDELKECLKAPKKT